MANDMSWLIKEFVKALDEREKKAVKPYDTMAEVVRVDGQTAYVHIPGGADETPVLYTMNARPGDTVRVRISGKKGWIAGNATNPPTDDTRANVAYSFAGVANETANEALDVAEVAEADAARAAAAAEAAESSATSAANSATAASASANTAGISASSAQAAAEAAEIAANLTITTDTIHYLATSLGSGVTRETTGWTTTVQTVTAENRYLWTYHTYTKRNSSTIDTDPVITGVYGQKGERGQQGPSGEDGNDGVGITEVVPQYGLSASTSTAPSTWSYTMVYDPATPYVWTREEITYSDSTAQAPHIGYSDPVYNQALTDTFSTVTQIKDYFWHDANGAHVLSNSAGVRYQTDIRGSGLEITKKESGATDVSVAEFGEHARIGRENDIHATIASDALALKINDDRLFEVKSDGIFNKVYFGQSTKAQGTTYTNQSVEATCDYLNDYCEPDSNLEKIVTIADQEDTGFTLSYDDDSSQTLGQDVYDVLDTSGAKFRSAKYWGLRYFPSAQDDKFAPDFILSPASEYQGAPILFDMGNAQIFAAGDTVQITEVLKVGKNGATIYDNQVFQVDVGNQTTALYINDSSEIYFNASSALETLITQLGWDSDLS